MKKNIAILAAFAAVSSLSAQTHFGVSVTDLTSITSGQTGFTNAVGFSDVADVTLIHSLNTPFTQVDPYGFGTDDAANSGVDQINFASSNLGGTKAFNLIGLNADFNSIRLQGAIAGDFVQFDIALNGTYDIQGLGFDYNAVAINGGSNDFNGITNSWQIAFNGGSFGALAGSSGQVTNTDTTFSVAIADQSNVSSFSLRYVIDSNLADLDGSTFIANFGLGLPNEDQFDEDSMQLDNLIFFGDGGSVSTFTVVPEPSAYAAIFGALSLAFVAYRRRR